MISRPESSLSGLESSQEVQKKTWNPRNYSGTIDGSPPSKSDTCVDKEGRLVRKSKVHTQTLWVMPFSGQFFHLVKGVQDHSSHHLSPETIQHTLMFKVYPWVFCLYVHVRMSDPLELEL